MPVTNTWGDDAKTILINDFQEPWTWLDFENGVLRGFEFIKTVDHPVYVIAKNFSNTPKGNAMAAFRRVENFPPNLALLIIHSEGFNPIGKVLINAFMRVYGRQAGKVIYADSMEDAHQIIDKHRQQLAARKAVS